MTKAIALLVAVLGVGGPTVSGADDSKAVTASKLTVNHWWTSPSESAALAGLVKLFQQKYPDVNVSALPLEGGSIRSQFPRMRLLILANRAPDVFQSNAGYAAQVFFDAGLLAPIDDVWTSGKLEPVIPPLIRDMCKFDGHYYSVPVSANRTNLIWYNKSLLDEYKIDPSSLTTWALFFNAAERLKAGGVPSPIQMGSTWTVAHVFECIMAGLGIAAYEDWINGKINVATDPRLLAALTTFQRYVSYSNKDNADIAWDQAIRRVMYRSSAFCITGDWANGEFRVAGMTFGKDYGAIPAPGTKGMYGVGVDTFQHPRGVPEPVNSTRWMSLVASREGQDAFNRLKGSIPARIDADPSAYDPYQRSAIADLKSAQHVYPNGASAKPEAFNAHITETLVAFMADEDVNKAASALAAAANRLTAAGQFRRTWSLK